MNAYKSLYKLMVQKFQVTSKKEKERILKARLLTTLKILVETIVAENMSILTEIIKYLQSYQI